MNLHEECLLKYLINPLDLFYTTELLKQNNSLIENKEILPSKLVNTGNLSYKTGRI